MERVVNMYIYTNNKLGRKIIAQFLMLPPCKKSLYQLIFQFL